MTWSLSAYGEIRPGLRALASATILKLELTNPSVASDCGNDAIGVPERTFSGSLDWEVPGIASFALNGRVIYTSGSDLNTANTLRFDGGPRMDFSARCSTEVAQKPVTVSSSRTLVASGSINF